MPPAARRKTGLGKPVCGLRVSQNEADHTPTPSVNVVRRKGTGMCKVKAPKAGKVLIFRNHFRHPKTGKVIVTGRPIPMYIDADKVK